MTEKRFNIEDGYYQGKTRPIIYDEESSDDYYFCGDYEDFKSICEQFNDFDIENKNLKKENKELKKKLSHAEKVNIGLIDENHRLRLTLIHSSDLNFDINWLKENLNDWNNKE